MAHYVNGFINKQKRLSAGAAKITRAEGRYDRTMFFKKGERCGVLAVWEHRMEWTLYADKQCSQHVDWSDPDASCLNDLTTPCGMLEVMSRLNGRGFRFDFQITHQ